MRVERIQIGAFGRFNDFDSGPEALEGLNVVLGPNEAGKSTLFHFLTTMLYGFHPASRETNPYSPWGDPDASGGVRITLDSGGCAEIERHLRSQPSGKMTSEGTTEEIRNRALPWVEHVPRTVFSQVFAVTLGDLAGLDSETWARIQDRLLGAMGASDLLPARTVAAELEQEAGALWRPQRRGNQRVRDLQDEIRKLRARRREAADRDKELRHLITDLERSRARLTQAREQRERERVALERVETLAPLRAGLVRIADLRAEGGPRERTEGLPGSPREEVAALDTRLAKLTSQLTGLDADAPAPLTDGEVSEHLLERSEEIRALGMKAAGLATDRARAASLELDLLELERQLDHHAASILDSAWRALPRGALASIPLSEFGQSVRELRAARDDRRIHDASTGSAAAPPKTSDLPAWVMPGAATLGGIALLAGMTQEVLTLMALGGAGLALSLTLLVQSRMTPPEPASNVIRDDLVKAERAAGDRVRGMVQDIPVKSTLLDDPDELLVAGLDRLQGLIRDHERRSAELRESSERVHALERDAQALAAGLKLDSSLGLDVLLQLLDSELRRAERAAETAAQIHRERHRLDRDRTRIREEVDEVTEQRDALVLRLIGVGGGDLDRGITAAAEAVRAHLRADQLEAELGAAHPDLEALRSRISDAEQSGESWTVTDDDLAQRRSSLERLSDEIEEMAARAEALDRDLAHSRGQETVDSVDGEIATLSDEETRLIRDRDRRWVLAQLIREADRRFREEHQPDLVRRAGSYLKHLTGGRYDRILVDETATGDLFQVTGPSLDRPVPLTPPISTGTLEQAYLSLRLAIVDHLDKGGERLPLFMDEAFVNWDPERRDRGMEVLTSVSRTRQVFVFTCHPEVATALGSAGARLLALDRGP